MELNTLLSMAGNVSDEDLMLGYRDGDSGAFALLYRRHKSGLYRYLLRKCGDKSIAEELFQDVWMKLIKARGAYEARAKFTTWLYQLAHNHTIDYYRRHRLSVVTNPPDEKYDIKDTQARDQDQPEVQAEIQQQTDRLLLLIDQLPHAQREAFVLREEGGFSIAEIAEITGVNNETAKSRLRYAVHKLRAGLEDK
jgi:RNA polymerase sigma-70 factor, ECF subfamily